MNDMSAVIVPKSDQINAEDFLAGPRTYTIEGVVINAGTEQPVNIKLRGEDRVWRPCKSMSRVLVAAWGPDASKYAGRAVTLYRDPKVKWGGMEVGGIRISHMSHIEREMLLQLAATKGKRAPHIVKPIDAPAPQTDAPDHEALAANTISNINRARDLDQLDRFIAGRLPKLQAMQIDRPELWASVDDALRIRRADLSLEQGRADHEHGDQHDGFEA